jgi:hypothetical protein
MVARKTSLINDRLLLMRYLYERSNDYLYLSGPTQLSLDANLLLAEDKTDFITSEVDKIYSEFIGDNINTMETREVGEIIAPAKYIVKYKDNLGNVSYTVTERTDEEIAQAICPEYDPTVVNPNIKCSLSKVSYDDNIVEQLKASGVATFEIYPLSEPSFQALSAAKKNGWSDSFWSADISADDKQHNKRVIDVTARIIVEDYTYPSTSMNSQIDFSHGPLATFLHQDGTYKNYIFPLDALEVACNNIISITGDSTLSCSDLEYFSRHIERSITDTSINSIDLSTVTVNTFNSHRMYGTSLLGKWTIDISPTLRMLENYQKGKPTYDGCPDPNEQCTAVEEFWKAFRGIQYKVFYVSVP